MNTVVRVGCQLRVCHATTNPHPQPLSRKRERGVVLARAACGLAMRAVPLLLLVSACAAAEPAWLTTGEFRWKSTGPLLAPVERPDDPCVSVKDPSVVFHDGRWHIFATIRSEKRTHQIEHISLADWQKPGDAKRTVLTCCNGYYCAPQVFYFTPQKKWYMIYQSSSPDWQPPMQPCFSTTDDITKPVSWTAPKKLYDETPTNNRPWIDFWVICDETKAHLFYTSLNGGFWRAETTIEKFPHGWSNPQKVLQADIFEASHTYRLKGLEKYITLVEAQAGGRRYYKAYLADRLDSQWRPLADSLAKPFAAPGNVEFAGEKWTDSFSHGELLRAGSDEKLEVDPERLRFLFQGVTDGDKAGKPYGKIPWRLGLLELK